MATLTTNTDTPSGAAGVSFPTVAAAHWLVRLPLATVFLYHGLTKFPNLAGGAEWIGLPLAIWTLVAIGEVLAGGALLAGGVLRTRLGDIFTRLGGLGVVIIMVGAIIIAHLGPWAGMEFQVLMLGAGLYLLLRGNAV